MLALNRFLAIIAILAVAICVWLGHSLLTQGASPTSVHDIQVGRPAPDFTLTDLHGKRFTLSAQKGHPVVLGFFCGCDRCHAAGVKIASLQREGKLRSFVAVVALDPAGAREFQHSTGLQGTILTDPSDATAEKYNSDFCPRLWRIAASGSVDYKSDVALEGSDLIRSLLDLSTINRD